MRRQKLKALTSESLVQVAGEIQSPTFSGLAGGGGGGVLDCDPESNDLHPFPSRYAVESISDTVWPPSGATGDHKDILFCHQTSVFQITTFHWLYNIAII